MSFLEHGLYGGAIVYKSSPQLFLWGVTAGILPDVPPFLFAIYKSGIKKAVYRFFWAELPKEDLPNSVYQLYYLTHSFITTFVLFILLYFINKHFSILALAYGFHILCDIP